MSAPIPPRDPEHRGRVQIHYVRARYAETDQMGVIHHGAYVAWIEEGRTEWLRASGQSYKAMEEEGLILTVMSLSLRYRSSACYDDRIKIETWLARRGGASLTFAYRLFLAEREGAAPGRWIADAETRLGLVDGAGRPRRLPPDLLQSLD